jgi:hypothetical protein
VEKALVPPSRYCVVEHVMHGLLGDIADRVADCEAASLKEAAGIIKAEKAQVPAHQPR